MYTPDLYGQNQKAKRPYNWVVINTKDKEGKKRLVLLELSPEKENAEIVHWYYLRDESLETIKRQAEREGGHILMLPSEGSEEAGGLSSRTPDLSSDSEDSEKDSSEQENVCKSYKISDVNALSEGMHQHSDAYNRIIELADAYTKEVAEHENDYEWESSYNDYWKRASLRQQKGSVIGNVSPREAALRDAWCRCGCCH